MGNYPDDFPDHLLDEDMDGVEKLSCGCYEEQCECPHCKNCGETLDDDNWSKWSDEAVCEYCEDDCLSEEELQIRDEALLAKKISDEAEDKEWMKKYGEYKETPTDLPILNFEQWKEWKQLPPDTIFSDMLDWQNHLTWIEGRKRGIHAEDSFNADDLKFKEWSDQEMKTHGKKESFDDWLDDELESHGDNVSLQDWGHHELDSHYERFGAEEIWCDACGEDGLSGDFHVITSMPVDFDSGSAGESATLCEDCYSKYGAEELKKDSCCCGATKSNPCACMIQGVMECNATCPCSLEKKGAETYEDSWEKGVIRLAIDSGCFSDEYAEWVYRQIDGASSTLNNPRFKKIIDKRWGLNAENWGGDPEGKLALALQKARDKAKEPRKPLKIEKLEAETFEGIPKSVSDLESLEDVRADKYEMEVNFENEDIVIVSGAELKAIIDDGWYLDSVRSFADAGMSLLFTRNPYHKAETSGQWEIGEQLEEAQMNAENYRFVKPVPISHSGGGHKYNGYYAIKGYEKPTKDGFTYRILSSPGTKDWYRVYVYDTEKMFQNKSRRLNPSGKMVGSSNPASHLIGSFPRLDDAKRALVFRMIQDEQYYHILSDGNLNWLLYGKNPGSRKWKAESFSAPTKGIDTFTKPFEEASLDSGGMKKWLVGGTIAAIVALGIYKRK